MCKTKPEIDWHKLRYETIEKKYFFDEDNFKIIQSKYCFIYSYVEPKIRDFSDFLLGEVKIFRLIQF